MYRAILATQVHAFLLYILFSMYNYLLFILHSKDDGNNGVTSEMHYTST